MTTTTTSQVSFRIRTDIAEKIPALAERHGVLTGSHLIEKLLKEALRAEGLRAGRLRPEVPAR